MIAIGAFGFGLVLGWASGFVAPSRGGLAFRLFLAVAGAAVLVGFGAARGVGLAGIALGLIAHETLLALLRRRAV